MSEETDESAKQGRDEEGSAKKKKRTELNGAVPGQLELGSRAQRAAATLGNENATTHVGQVGVKIHRPLAQIARGDRGECARGGRHGGGHCCSGMRFSASLLTHDQSVRIQMYEFFGNKNQPNFCRQNKTLEYCSEFTGKHLRQRMHVRKMRA
jgi:hypothetical protein